MARKEQRAAYLFLSPWLFGLAAFWLIPIGASVLLDRKSTRLNSSHSS